MKVTSKGQVTIPKNIRENTGILPGTEVELIQDGKEVRVRRLSGGRTRGDEIVERLRNASGGDIPMSTDEIMRLTRGED
jgi:AbrB family looped-hinge helix DNA binding protein